MDKKHLFFVAALAVVLLSTRNLAVAQDSASQPTRQDTAPKVFANGGNFQAPSDEDIQLCILLSQIQPTAELLAKLPTIAARM